MAPHRRALRARLLLLRYIDGINSEFVLHAEHGDIWQQSHGRADPGQPCRASRGSCSVPFDHHHAPAGSRARVDAVDCEVRGDAQRLADH